MSDKARAISIVNDEIVQKAFQGVMDAANKRMLVSKSPDEREACWHEYHGAKRAWASLRKWAEKPEKD